MSSYRNHLVEELTYKYPNLTLLATYNINFSSLTIKNPNLKNAIPATLLQDLKAKRTTLVIDLSQEGELDFIQQLYEVIIALKIPPKQIVFVCSSIDYKSEVLRVFKNETINLEWFMYFEMDQKRIFLNDIANNLTEYNYPNPLLNPTFSKSYLNLNRRWKSHREALVTLLYDKGILNKGHNSFSGKDFKIKYNEDISSVNDYKSMFVDFDSKDLHVVFRRSKSVRELFPLVLDTESFARPLALTTQRPLVNFYQSSYFSVVTETLYNYPIRFITEKVFRPITHKHPFILLAPPKSLEILKSLGYKTFSSVIDESYDNELDHNKRLIMVVNEIERLCNLTETQLQHYKESLIPIVEHNYRNIMDRPQIYRKLI